MRYWILTTEFPPLYGGGISTYCIITAKMLQEQGHEVTVFLPDFTVKSVTEKEHWAIRVVHFYPRQTDAHQFLGYNAYLSYEFANIVKQYILKEGKPDVIEAQEYQAIAYYIQQFKWQGTEPFNDLKIVITCHSPSFICLEYNHVPVHQFPNYWTGEMEKACIKSADLVMLPSHYLRGELEKRLPLNEVNYQIVPNPATPFSDHQPNVIIDEKMMVCFGKLAPLKGTFELLNYFSELWNSGSDLRLYIIGGTNYFFYPEGKTMLDIVRSKYKSYIDKNLLVLVGNLTPQQCTTYLQKAKVVIVPSLFDNFPYTVLEAMSIGKVVLASKQGGQTEMIQHGINGFLFDHKIAGDFQEQLQTVLDLDAIEYNTISNNSRQTIDASYSSEVVYPQKIKAIQEVIDAPDRTTYPFIHDINEIAPTAETSVADKNNLLSVVVPFYNMGAYIDECVTSIFQSDYPYKEVIVINDGSTDQQSVEQLYAIKKKFPIQVITTKNQGLAATRNYGASIAKGTYLAFLDADDTVAPTYYRKAIQILSKYPNVHFAGCWLTYFGEGTGTWPTFNPEPPYLLIHNTINSSAVVFKHHTFLNHGQNSPDLVYGMEDWETVIHLTKKGYRGVVIPEKLFNYRVRKGSMSQSFTREKQLYLTRLIAQKHQDFYGLFGGEIAQLLNSNGSSIYFDNPTFEVVQMAPSKRLSAIKQIVKEYIKRSKVLRQTAYFIYKKIKR